MTLRAEPASSFLCTFLVRMALAVLALFAFAGCAADAEPEDDEAAQSEDAILGGAVENGWPAVGMLRFASGNFGSGALVTPTVVLTAAHVASGNPTQFLYGTPPPGKDPRPENLRAVAVAEIVIHPCFATPKAKGCPSGGDPIDVALVRLATPVTDVAPLRIVDQPLEMLWGLLSPYEGDSCHAIGFGAFLDGAKRVSFGVRRSAKSTVREVNATELVTVRGSGIATSGDSGGPLVCGGKIIGTVRGAAGGLVKGSPYERTREGYERTDLWRSWIAMQTRAWNVAIRR